MLWTVPRRRPPGESVPSSLRPKIEPQFRAIARRATPLPCRRCQGTADIASNRFHAGDCPVIFIFCRWHVYGRRRGSLAAAPGSTVRHGVMKNKFVLFVGGHPVRQTPVWLCGCHGCSSAQWPRRSPGRTPPRLTHRPHTASRLRGPSGGSRKRPLGVELHCRRPNTPAHEVEPAP